MPSTYLTYLSGGHSPTPDSPDAPASHPLLARAWDLWEALPDDLPQSVYLRIADGTNECLEAGDRSGLEALYATATALAVAS